jgi:hypothetical protein
MQLIDDYMSVRLVVAITDRDWFEHLRHRRDLPEINFWAPSGANFKALSEGELFLFKLHAPNNFIVGGGVSHTQMSCHALSLGRLSGKRMAQAHLWKCVAVSLNTESWTPQIEAIFKSAVEY